MEKTAILMIDLINDFHFEEGDLLLKHTRQIIPHLKKLKEYAHKHHYPIIYVNDHYETWSTNYREIAETCRTPENDDIIQLGLPEKEDYFIMKPQMSAFFRTPLGSLLEELQIEHLIMAGIAGNICILFSANDAHMRGYTLHVPENCIASNTKKHNEEAIQLMRQVFNAKTKAI